MRNLIGVQLSASCNQIVLQGGSGMKIAIVGYSGSGKSTLARILAKKYQTDVLHFDTVQFLPNWGIRSDAEKEKFEFSNLYII